MGEILRVKKRPERIIVDMDGVLANFELALYRRLKDEYPDYPIIELKDRTTVYPRDQYPKQMVSVNK